MTSKEKTPPSTERAKSANKSKPKDKEECFVIMPFGGWFDTYFENVYKPASG